MICWLRGQDLIITYLTEQSGSLLNHGDFKLAEVIMGHDIVDGRGYDYGEGFSLERKKTC